MRDMRDMMRQSVTLILFRSTEKESSALSRTPSANPFDRHPHNAVTKNYINIAHFTPFMATMLCMPSFFFFVCIGSLRQNVAAEETSFFNVLKVNHFGWLCLTTAFIRHAMYAAMWSRYSLYCSIIRVYGAASSSNSKKTSDALIEN